MNFVLIPVKALPWGKSRLSPVLSEAARHALARAMLTDVLTSALRATTVDRVAVISSDTTLLALARGLGAFGVDEGYPRGLNGAADVGTDFCVRHNASAVLVLLADVPLVTAADVDLLFGHLSGDPQVVLVPCKEGQGTNAVLRSPPQVVKTCFGGPSLAAYQREAARHGICCCVVEIPRIALDLDSVADLWRFAGQKTETHTYRALEKYGILDRAPQGS